MPGGEIYGYRHPNEWTYIERQDGGINIFGKDGRLSRIFEKHGDGYLGQTVHGGQWGFFLVPTIALAKPRQESSKPAVLVNSIPKSGTYFVAQILSDLGFESTGLHLSGAEVCDDYRNVPNELVHVRPADCRRRIPLHFIARALMPGEVAVGHIGAASVIKQFLQHGVKVISLKRNLRDVLTSLYFFKLSRVAATGLGDETWRETSEQDRFIAFLSFFAEKDILNLRGMADLMAGTPHCLDYEDLFQTKTEGLAEFQQMLSLESESAALAAIIAAARKKKTTTLSEDRNGWRNVWDARAEKFFERSGLKSKNMLLGYE